MGPLLAPGSPQGPGHETTAWCRGACGRGVVDHQAIEPAQPGVAKQLL